MIADGISEDRFTESKRKLFLEYLGNVKDWKSLELTKENWSDMLTGLSYLAQLEDETAQSSLAIQFFFQVVQARPADMATIFSILAEELGTFDAHSYYQQEDFDIDFDILQLLLGKSRKKGSEGGDDTE